MNQENVFVHLSTTLGCDTKQRLWSSLCVRRRTYIEINQVLDLNIQKYISWAKRQGECEWPDAAAADNIIDVFT